MTITRADVEAMLKIASVIHEHNYGVIAEACKAWLAVDDAPSGETESYRDFGSTTMLKTNAYIPAGTYKLVCIDTPTGGREGS